MEMNLLTNIIIKTIFLSKIRVDLRTMNIKKLFTSDQVELSVLGTISKIFGAKFINCLRVM